MRHLSHRLSTECAFDSRWGRMVAQAPHTACANLPSTAPTAALAHHSPSHRRHLRRPHNARAPPSRSRARAAPTSTPPDSASSMSNPPSRRTSRQAAPCTATPTTSVSIPWLEPWTSDPVLSRCPVTAPHCGQTSFTLPAPASGTWGPTPRRASVGSSRAAASQFARQTRPTGERGSRARGLQRRGRRRTTSGCSAAREPRHRRRRHRTPASPDAPTTS